MSVQWPFTTFQAFARGLRFTGEKDILVWKSRCFMHADRRKAERRQIVSDSLAAWENCRRREQRRKEIEAQALSHSEARFSERYVSACTRAGVMPYWQRQEGN